MDKVVQKAREYEVNGFIPRNLVELLLDESYNAGIHDAWVTVFKAQDYVDGLRALDELKRGSEEPQDSTY